VQYNEKRLLISEAVLNNSSSASRCQKPVISSFSNNYLIRTDNSTVYSGFGLQTLDNVWSLVAPAQLKFRFRTFVPDAVLILVTGVDPSSDDYYELYLLGGRVYFSISCSGNVVTLNTAAKYNTGQWYQVTFTILLIILIKKFGTKGFSGNQ
jgi:Laminin G domain